VIQAVMVFASFVGELSAGAAMMSGENGPHKVLGVVQAHVTEWPCIDGENGL
jgi:hypothetical protein